MMTMLKTLETIAGLLIMIFGGWILWESSLSPWLAGFIAGVVLGVGAYIYTGNLPILTRKEQER